jgi:hypothetical protein
MESITPKERFIPCTNCNHPVSSILPTCERCGLEMSGDGIDDLARTEEAKTLAIEKAIELKRGAVLFLLYSIFVSFFFSKNVEYSRLFLLGLWIIALGVFISNLIRWNQNHSQKHFEFDLLEEAKKEKKRALFIFMSAVCFTALCVWWTF